MSLDKTESVLKMEGCCREGETERLCLMTDELPMQLHVAPVPGSHHAASIVAQDEQHQRLWC